MPTDLTSEYFLYKEKCTLIFKSKCLQLFSCYEDDDLSLFNNNGYWLEIVEKGEKERRERTGGDFSEIHKGLQLFRYAFQITHLIIICDLIFT